MKRMLLVLALAGGVMGCDANQRSRGSQGAAVNPLTLLDQSLGMREAVCQYGLRNYQFDDLSECEAFWKKKDKEMENEIKKFNREKNRSRIFPGREYMNYEVIRKNTTLVMFYGAEKSDYAGAQWVIIMSGGVIDWRKR